jgi:hypothetical protein
VSDSNWDLLVEQYYSRITRLYEDEKGKIWRFFGLVHSDDDYYYGMVTLGTGKLQLLSCAGNLESFGLTLVEYDE